MNASLKTSTITLAVAIELAGRTLQRLEESGKVSSLDPTRRVELNKTVLATQLAQAIIAAVTR